VTKTAGGATTFNRKFVNNGVLQLNGLDINMNFGVEQSGNNAETDLGGGRLGLDNTREFLLDGGTLRGSGWMGGNLKATRGNILIGPSQTLTVTGMYTQTSLATLTIQASAANSWGKLVVDKATLGGILAIELLDEYEPPQDFEATIIEVANGITQGSNFELGPIGWNILLDPGAMGVPGTVKVRKL
jgi:hypothetical protein